MPGLSDYVIMVRGRAKAFLAGPPLLKAATGEIATDEELGGAEMHTSISGLGEYLAEDDADALRIARDVVSRLQWNAFAPPSPISDDAALAPKYSPDELAGAMPLEVRQPIDMREIIARIVDRSEFLEFGADYGPQTVVGHASIHGQAVGIITNNGSLDPAGANKATHFIQACSQSGTPLIYLQNTTGYIVGKASEQAGMIKHGSKMIQAVSNANVPSITIHCGASFGAGNYGMCGRAFGPRFVFSWPNARTAVMGGEQAALTMRIVTEAGAKRKGEAVDEAALSALEKKIIDNFERQAGAFYTSGKMLDDGVIDPRDTRKVLAMVLDICRRPTAARCGRCSSASHGPEPLSNHPRPGRAHGEPSRRGPPEEHDMIYTEQHIQMMDAYKRFIDAEINPFVDEWEKAQIFPAHELFKKMGQQGFLGVTKPVEYGGLGLDYSYSVALAEATGPHQLRRRADGHRRADRHGHAGARAFRLRRSCAASSSPRRSPATTSPVSACRRSAQAPTSRRSRPPPARTATTT